GLDEGLHLLKRHLPYHESDHVLNIAYNLLAGGSRLEHIEVRRNDEAYLDALGARRIPDPTTAGDVCRRFTEGDVEQLMGILNETRSLPRFRALWTNAKDPRSNGGRSCEIPRSGRSHDRSSDQNPSTVLTWTSRNPSPPSSRANSPSAWQTVRCV